MKYYKLYFDRNFEDGLVYSSRESLPLYVRVLAKLRGKLATAIVGEEVAEPAEFKCLPILEVLDDEPILSKELCRLAAWISRYYHYPFGMSLFEVLDSGAKVDVGQKVCKLKEKVGERLLEILPASGSVTLGKLCKDYGKSGFYKKLEQLEQAGYLRVLRSNSKASLKGKENYLRLVEKNWAKLKNAPKQAELLEYLAGCKSCPMFVPLVENGYENHQITDILVREYLQNFLGKIDTLILGCTHYPVLKKSIDNFFDGKVNLIDSGVAISRFLKTKIESSTQKTLGKNHFFVTDNQENFLLLARKILNDQSIKLEHVNLV